MMSPAQITGEIIETQFHQRKMANNNGCDAASSGNVNVFVQLSFIHNSYGLACTLLIFTCNACPKRH